MTAAEFWASTVAQLAALLPETDGSSDEGSASDLMALASM